MEEAVHYRVALQQTLRDYENFAALHERVGKGSVNLINNSNGKRIRSTVTGVVVNGVGYGTAVVKGARSWKVEVK